MFGGVEWDWDWVQHDDIQVRGPKVSWDNCIGSKVERAFAAGRQACKDGSKSNPYKYSDDLSDAFWNGWRWQRERVKPPNNQVSDAPDSAAPNRE